MGERLMRYYQYVAEEAGMKGKFKLAQLTKIPAIHAATMNDTPEVLRRFANAVKEVTGKPAPDF